eukprot:jgi/Galph1/2642/GphlegSOOS_G1314.1
MTQDSFQHRSTLSQKNKAFKGHQGHSSKRSLKKASKGRVKSTVEYSKSQKKLSNKLEKENKQKQLRQAKTAAVIERRRRIAQTDAPCLVLLLPFTHSADPFLLHQWIREAKGVSFKTKQQKSGQWSDYVSLKGSNEQAITRWNLVSVNTEDQARVSDLLKIADVLVPVFHTDELPDNFSFAAFCCEMLRVMGVPRLLSAALFPETSEEMSTPLKQHDVLAIRKLRAQYLVSQSLSEEIEQVRPIQLSNETQVQQLIRVIATKTPRIPRWREVRSYLLADHIDWVNNEAIKVVGYIRGKPWNVRRLFYLSGICALQPYKIVSLEQPYFKKPSEKKKMQVEEQILFESTCLDEPLESVDAYYNEEDNIDIENHQDNEDSEQRMEDDEEEKTVLSDEEPFEDPSEDIQAMDGMDWKEENNLMDEEVDRMEEEDVAMEREELKNEMKDELLFPDEVDTPLDQPARERFAKYRGLVSLANSEWNPEEGLAPEFKKIFKFANFNLFKKRQLSQERSALVDATKRNDFIQPGSYVAFYLNVREQDREYLVERLHVCNLFIGVCLHRHEHRFSVVHFRVRRTLLDYKVQEAARTTSEDDELWKEEDIVTCPSSILQSKDLVEVHCGFFKYLAKPIFSIPVNNSTKLKYIRFFPNHRSVVASVYGPCVYSPAPVLVIKPVDGHFVAQGCVISIDTDRIILKRIVLSGFPYRVFKSKAVVRYMFFNREDILWFQENPLWTKRGRLGNIIEPVGTHGYMKCRFNGHIKTQDTVCMSIYKRVFPKWVSSQEYLQHSFH